VHTRELSLDIRERIADVDGATWDVLARDDSVFLSRAYLSALESALPANVRTRYVVVRRGPVPVAAISGQLIHVDGETVLPSVAPEGKGRKRHRAAAFALGAVDVDLFLVGNFMSWGHPGVALTPHASPAEVWPLIGEALDMLGERDPDIGRADVELLLDVPEHALAHARVLEERRFERFENEPDMVLAIDESWNTYDDYLGALNTKYRKAARDMDKRLATARCVLERGVDVRTHEAAIHALYLDVHARSPFRFVTVREGFLSTLQGSLGDRFSLNVIRRGDEILAFGTTLDDGARAIAYLVGHDPNANADLPLYLRLLLASVEDGIARRKTHIAYGRTALEPKARTGAKPVPLTVFARHTSRVLHAVVAPWLARLVPKGAPPERSPFKTK
jgi:hypothetical protein